MQFIYTHTLLLQVSEMSSYFVCSVDTGVKFKQYWVCLSDFLSSGAQYVKKEL